MNIKLLIGGKEIDAQISEADAQKIQPSESRFVRKARGKDYFYIYDDEDRAGYHSEDFDDIDDALFSKGNYFTSEKQAQDHIRALKLWQAIKVFRQEREGDAWKKLNWHDSSQIKYCVCYGYESGKVVISSYVNLSPSCVYFAHRETAQAVIDEFYGELMWYFTEFEDD